MPRQNKIEVIINASDQTAKAIKSAKDRFKSLEDTLGSLGKKMQMAGAGITGGLAAAVGVSAKLGDDLAKASKRIGITHQELQALGFAAKIAGADMKAMQLSLRRTAQNSFDAAKGLVILALAGFLIWVLS